MISPSRKEKQQFRNSWRKSVTYSHNSAKLYQYYRYLILISTKGTTIGYFQCYCSRILHCRLPIHTAAGQSKLSCHTILKRSKQSHFSRDGLNNNRMTIGMNSTGTAFFGPRPPVAKFLQKNERRNKVPTDFYINRQSVKVFRERCLKNLKILTLS